MKAGTIARRFLVQSFAMTIVGYFRYKAYLSPRAEVDLSSRVRIGRKTRVSSFSKLKDAGGPLEIGERCAISTGCFISAGAAGTRIGNDCLIGANCTIVSNTYKYTSLDTPLADQGHESRGTVIGNNCLIGSSAVIVDGARIGNNVIIDALSHVSGDIPDDAVVQGNPAKVIFIRR